MLYCDDNVILNVTRYIVQVKSTLYLHELIMSVRQHRANHFALTLNNLPDDGDRMFVQEECKKHLTVRELTDDACCDNCDVNADCADVASCCGANALFIKPAS